MRKIYYLVFMLFTTIKMFGQTVTIYTVDRNDFSNMIQTITTQEEAETDYKTLILVYDYDRKEVIGGCGAYVNMVPTQKILKKIVNDAMQGLYKGLKNKDILRDPFNKVLGLDWGMTIENAIDKLEKIGLSSWEQAKDNKIICIQKIAWEGTLYDAVILTYFISNKQNKYLNSIEFVKLCNNAEDAKRIRNEIKLGLILNYSSEAIKEEVGKNKFIYYMVHDSFGTSRINLRIGKSTDNSYYLVTLWYNELFKASDNVRKDDESL